ncbi:MAG: sodium:proton antiporter [Lachnospiraceae bacterium]|nr:sodium:proton antiporter [Lachnospiraceae bacterium]
MMENTLILIAMGFLSVTIFLCLVRAVMGPRMTDRLVAVNIISIKGVVLILLLGQYLHDNRFMDVSLVYTLLSFLAVICLARNMLARAAKEEEKEETNGTA